ncbi:proteasome assembly chaperone family protein [Halocatena pleomorpha]|uniref:Proteasome assembly chaperone family protein n=1 Tax=Halocatena pleomorpha TaxID=1785090 RepID=A0A3P3RK73_9EURY|nr:PAC2 family protein [Halocatena pleomorpha]RRJ33785.1 proteasome assembly chaperone family protein [Halocatena pleomorpha]
MAHITIKSPDITLDEPTLIDGLPGKGLIGKLITDYLVSTLEMEYYAGVYCESIPPVAAYRSTDPRVRPPLQIYADETRNLLVLVSDIPIPASNAPDFAGCITDWLNEEGVTPIYISGFSETIEQNETDHPERLYGLTTGRGEAHLEKAEIASPHHAGIVTGPTGTLLNQASDDGLDSVGLLVKSTDTLPDYEAARIVIDQGIEPITGIEIDTEPFVEQSIDISPVAESALQQLGESSDGSTRAQPTATFH